MNNIFHMCLLEKFQVWNNSFESEVAGIQELQSCRTTYDFQKKTIASLKEMAGNKNRLKPKKVSRIDA